MSKYLTSAFLIICGGSLLFHAPAVAQDAAVSACAKTPANPSDQDAAIAACTSVVKSGLPSRVRENAFYNRAQIYRKQKKWDEAAADFTSAIVIDPKDISAFVNRGDVKMYKGDYAAAVDDFTTCIKGSEATYYPPLRRGVAYLGSNDYENAISDFNAALKFDSDNAAKFNTPDIKLQNDSYPTYGRGLAKIKSGDVAGGNADLEKAVALNPDVADFFQRFGIVKPAS